MAQFKSAACSAAAISIFITGSAAYADVTAEQVWNDWRQYMVGFGYELQATESMSGDTLTVDDLVMNVVFPEDEGSMSMTLGQFQFTNNGDGTVSMSIPPQMPMNISVKPSTGEVLDMIVDYNTSGYSVVVSGDPEDMTYNFSVAQMEIALNEIRVDGTPVDLATGSMTMSDLAGSSNMKVGDIRATTQRMTSGPLTFEADLKDPEGPGRMQIKGNYASIGFNGDGTIPLDMDPNDISAMLNSGFAFDGAFDFGAGGAEFTFTEEGETVQGTTNTGGGMLNVAMDPQGLNYSGEASDYRIQLLGGELPFPIELAMQKGAFNLVMPISRSDAEQDFAFGITFGDFTMSELLWALFDSGAQLPRDPATIALDLTGKVKLMVDLLDPGTMEAMERGEIEPGELTALNINDMTVSVAGAELTGEGGFTFDNNDKVTFDGMPAPTGELDLKLEGGNGLLDKLVAMGLLPEDQAMGARMMMGLFAIPGPGEDTLNSKIEVSGDGQVKANGQRIR